MLLSVCAVTPSCEWIHVCLHFLFITKVTPRCRLFLVFLCLFGCECGAGCRAAQLPSGLPPSWGSGHCCCYSVRKSLKLGVFLGICNNITLTHWNISKHRSTRKLPYVIFDTITFTFLCVFASIYLFAQKWETKNYRLYMCACVHLFLVLFLWIDE
jgi:hypothetical protein